MGETQHLDYGHSSAFGRLGDPGPLNDSEWEAVPLHPRRPWGQRTARQAALACRLTDQEVDVLRRIAVGGSMEAAVADLNLVPNTVDFHLQNIYSKVGITSRAAATLFAIQNDLLRA